MKLNHAVQIYTRSFSISGAFMHSNTTHVATASQAGHATKIISAPVAFSALIAASVGFAVLATAFYYTPFHSGLHEDGPVEKVSAALWALCAIMVFYFATLPALRKHWQIPMLFSLLCARELDFDKRFLSEGILQLRLYSGDAPLWEKAIGATVILLVLIVLWRLLWVNVPILMSGLRHLSAWAWGGVFAVGSIVVAKCIDGIGRKFADFGVTLDPQLIETAMVYEELLELFAAAIVAWSICLVGAQIWRDKKA
ncbi:hypothetical protein J3366_11015 [Tritonibacter mobilis]